MSTILAAIIAIIVAIAVCYALYMYRGWSAFSFINENPVTFTPDVGSSISKLRFKNCNYEVIYNGQPYSVDVTGNLNNMAKAYTDYNSVTTEPSSLGLVNMVEDSTGKNLINNNELTYKSFVIPALNDSASTSALGPATTLANTKEVSSVTLTGYVRTI